MREDIEYTVLYEECAESEVYFHSMWEDIKGYLDGKSPKEILETEMRIHKCLCGGAVELHEFEGMGDGDYTILCKSCGRTMRRSLYDVDIHDWEHVLEYCIRDWNAGLSAEDIEEANRAEHERKRLREEDLTWHELRPNNMKCNPVEGYYSLVMKRSENRIYCCKWTIKYQLEEVEPGCVSSNSTIEAYNLFEKRIWEVVGSLCYPEPCDEEEFPEKSEHTFSHLGVNDAGDFVRSYKTLEEAKLGALSRCGWQGLNRDTILREADVHGKTAAEVIETWNHAGNGYRNALAALYDAQENAPLPVQVQYGNESITGIVTVVDCRKDIFDIEMPGEFAYENLDIWKVKKVEKIPREIKALQEGRGVKIWLDDLRPTPEGYESARSVREAQALIEQIEAQGGTIEVLDLDHDLGDYARFGGDGIKLLDYLLERGTLYPVKFHTANPVGRANMERMVERYWT